MNDDDAAMISRSVDAAISGDSRAGARLLELMYTELRALARARMADLSPGQTLQPTALVHEAYLRIARDDRSWEGRSHFFFAAARAMRDILVEQARRRGSLKRGGDRQRVEPAEADLAIAAPIGDVLGVHEALEKLETEDPEQARLVLLKYFVGMSNAEVADVLECSLSTIERRWRFARAWLRRELARDNSRSP